MKKDLDWLNNELEKVIKDVESDDISFAGKKDYDEGYIDGIRDVQSIVNQIDNQEVLSEEWIERNTSPVDDEGRLYVWKRDLQNAIVPKQELPVIPKFVAEWFENDKRDMEIEDVFWQIENCEMVKLDVDRWISDNRNTFIRAWLDGYTVEEEQKYYVLDSEDIPLLERANDQTYKTTTGLSIYEDGRDNSRFELTEQEIKDYDERYMAFAKPVVVCN